MIPKHTEDELKRLARIEDIAPRFTKVVARGNRIIGECKVCGTDGKLTIHKAKNIATCFKCDQSGQTSTLDPIGMLRDAHYGNLSYGDALRWLASEYNVIIDEDKKKSDLPVDASIKRKQTPPKERKKGSFRDLQMAASGISEKDQKSLIRVDGDTKHEIDRYVAGTFNERFELVDGDDMVMHYVGLDRRPKEVVGKRGKRTTLVRVRFQNPELHLDKDGEPTKYKSPAGSGSALWLPDRIIRDYENGVKIPTLFIQEGEKKADRATIAGIPSVGIGGIHMIAGKNAPMPYEFEMIIKRCQVDNVVFMVDSDCFDLSTSLSAPADQRPKSFLRAIGNYRQYFYAFQHNNIMLNIYFGHVLKNTADAKGIDDLLQSGLLKDAELVQDVADGLAKKESRWVKMYDITNQGEHNLRELWHLQGAQEFADRYHEQLKGRKSFIISGIKWRFGTDGRTIEMAQPLTPDEVWWNEKETKFGKDYQFNNIRCLRFLYNRGFGLLKRPNDDFTFIYEEGGIVDEINSKRIREFCVNFIKTHEGKNEALVNTMLKGAKVYFGPDALSDIDYRWPTFHRNDRGVQYFYFRETFWRITAKDIEELPFSSVEGRVWKNKVVDFKARMLDRPLVSISRIDDAFLQRCKRPAFFGKYKDKFLADFADGYEDCEFLDFLINTSNFYHEKEDKGEELTDDERMENQQHLLAKMTALGHLMHGYRDENNEYAIISMEGNMVEGGRSEGGTGKSLLGKAIEKVVPVEFINGKKDNLMQDQFLFGNVTDSTAVVIIDDVRQDFDLEHFFPQITGHFYVRPLGKQGYTLKPEDSPKLYITTNFAPNERGRSYTRRRRLVAFSDFFNDNREPSDYYGHLLFTDWDHRQWNLFYNLMANCLQLYFIAGGVIEAPYERLEKRMLRQDIGETFIQWADDFFIAPTLGASGRNMNVKLEKNDLYKEGNSSFLKVYPAQQRFVSVSKFKEKLWKYALLMDYEINPGKKYEGKRIAQYVGKNYGGDDKSGGTEFVSMCLMGYETATDEDVF